MKRLTSLAVLLLAPSLALSVALERRQEGEGANTTDAQADGERVPGAEGDAGRPTAGQQYLVENKCPGQINVWVGGRFDRPLAPQASWTHYGRNPTFIYTDANGGNGDGSRTLRAGFYFEDGKLAPTYYYLVKDPAYTNVGMSITPMDSNPKNGYCNVATCLNKDCSDAYATPPTRFPASTTTPAKPPLFQCAVNQPRFRVTFCPGGKWPSAPPQPTQPPGDKAAAIHPNGNPNKCLDVRAARFANGTPVQIYDCNGTAAQKWVFRAGSTKVRVEGTNYCLDAGTSPANGIGMKIWTCHDNLAAQQWRYTGERRLELEGKGFCLDLTRGQLWNGNLAQTWSCTRGNLNQVWTV